MWKRAHSHLNSLCIHVHQMLSDITCMGIVVRNTSIQTVLLSLRIWYHCYSCIVLINYHSDTITFVEEIVCVKMTLGGGQGLEQWVSQEGGDDTNSALREEVLIELWGIKRQDQDDTNVCQVWHSASTHQLCAVTSPPIIVLLWHPIVALPALPPCTICCTNINTI